MLLYLLTLMLKTDSFNVGLWMKSSLSTLNCHFIFAKNLHYHHRAFCLNRLKFARLINCWFGYSLKLDWPKILSIPSCFHPQLIFFNFIWFFFEFFSNLFKLAPLENHLYLFFINLKVYGFSFFKQTLNIPPDKSRYSSFKLRL